MRYLSENNNEFGISTDEKREDTQKDPLPWQRHVLDFLEIKRNEKKNNKNNNNGKLTLVAKSRRKQTVCNIYGYSMWFLVRDFSENDKIFCREKKIR